MCLHVTFVSCNHDYDVFIVSMVSKLSDPFFNFLKGLAWNNFIDNDGSDCITIVDRSNSIVKLLASCIPDSQFDKFAIMVWQFEILL